MVTGSARSLITVGETDSVAESEAGIRQRRPSDLEQLDAVARLVRATDGYPLYLVNDNFRGFLASPKQVAAWVAVQAGEIVGHVALSTTASPEVLEVLSTSGECGRPGVVSRLLVAPDARREGLGTRLLKHAADAAREAGLVPVLDVVSTSMAAIALYERAGWRRLGVAHVRLPDGHALDEVVFLAPQPVRG